MTKDLSTEEKIKQAAKEIFQQKGFAGAKTRDIAERAGINLALLNYYFRSKEKLFGLVMEDSVQELFLIIRTEVFDSESSLIEKIVKIVNTYFDVLKTNANLPLFILGEIQANPDTFAERLNLPNDFLVNTALYQQVKAQLKIAGIEHINPLHILINVLSLTIFPFIASPMIRTLSNFPDNNFDLFIEERRTQIPIWIKSMLKIED